MQKPVLEMDFEPDCLAAFDVLRGALIDLYASVGADPNSPQDAARRFRVNKTLTWNISKVIGSNDPIASLPSVPGSSALRSLLQAMQKEGASSEVVGRVRDAAKALHGIVEMHVGDRATLELVVDGMGKRREDHLELSRKLAFRGNSGIWGVQARTRLMSVLMAPNADDEDMIDMAIVRGYIGFRRLRTDVRWPIFQLRGWGEEGLMTSMWEALDPEGNRPGGLPLLQRFSTVKACELEEVRTASGRDYMLASGPIGNTGAVDCYVSDCAKAAASKYRTGEDTTGEFGATISAPTERLVFDLLVDERLAFALTPEVRAFGGVFHERSEQAVPEGQLPIPVSQSVVALPGQPPAIATPAAPGYPEIVNFAQERMGWKSERLKGCRLEMSYPPLGSTVLLRFKLPERPTANQKNG
ncbi:MAG TPA: hypothetical protein VG711_10200 [Phycisphaerales bacterium]|nr:hypothetical protein [Phycisphaerales bacterium]